MKPIPGAPPPDIGDLTRATDRLSFIYLEHTSISRDSDAITATDEQGTIHIPAATIATILLGPGTSITHHALMLAFDCGATIVWVGEEGVRYYGHGRGLSQSTKLLQSQASLVSKPSSRLAVARAMYTMRFPGEDLTKLTMQQLRGREGTRVRNGYRSEAAKHHLTWNRRSYNVEDATHADEINQALSAATTCLYGLVHSITIAIGCSPDLGFIHTGKARSFVYDIADLYRMSIAVPIAFACAAEADEDLTAQTRRAMRDTFHTTHLADTCIRDIRTLLGTEDTNPEEGTTHLWNGGADTVPGGQLWDTPW